MKDEETRVIDPKTGGMKGRKLAELGALDPLALLQVAQVAGYGGRKYERLNYMKGYAWSLSFDAMQRHLLHFWAGEDIDEESGLPHLAHAAWHCLALLAFAGNQLGTDDRYQPPCPSPDCILLEHDDPVHQDAGGAFLDGANGSLTLSFNSNSGTRNYDVARDRWGDV